jgi:hypothetical protein
LDEKLGNVPDGVLALEIGVDRKSIEYRRETLGIARCPQQHFVIPPMAGWNRIDWPESVTSRFGTLPDYVLGKELGVQKSVIARARQRAGIPSFAEQQGHPTRYSKGHRPTRWNKAG